MIKYIIIAILCLGMSINMTINKPIETQYVIKIDFSRPSTEKRLWLIDTKTKEVILHTYVAHGKNSGTTYATKFSNDVGSNMSSLGRSLTAEIYVGKHGQSIKLDGLDKTNNNMRKRAIVIHSATYIEDGAGGRSLGCFAVPRKAMQIILKYAEHPILVEAYI